MTSFVKTGEALPRRGSTNLTELFARASYSAPEAQYPNSRPSRGRPCSFARTRMGGEPPKAWPPWHMRGLRSVLAGPKW
jgi:hypothetical protein